MSDVSVKLSMQEDVSAKLSKVTAEARTASSQLQQMGRQIDNAFKTSSPGQFASRLGNAMDEAIDGADALGSSLEAAMKDLDLAMNVDIADGFQDAAEEAGKLAEATKDVGDSARGLEESVSDLGNGGSSLEGLRDGADSAGESMDRAQVKAGGLGNALKKLFAVVSAAVVLHQVGGFVNASVGIGRDFTSMMSEVQAISGASGSEIAQLEETARSYGATTVFSATEAAEALKYMSLAGWDANQSSSALGGVLNLAAASGMGLGQASDMVTDYLSAFGMEASQSTYFADMLSYAQSNSNTTAAQLGEAYRNSAANLHAAGQDVETTTSLLESMANQGYKGSEAGTALAATMRDITQKMDDGAIKIGDASIAVQDSEGNFRDLTDILFDVEEATSSMGDAQRAEALGATFTADSIKALNMILAEGMDKVSGYEEELRIAGGTAEEMAGIMNDNLTGDIANMSSAYEEMQLQIFENLEGPLRGGVQYITNETIPALTEWLPEAFGSAATGIAAAGNALKPILETVLKNPQVIGKAFASIAAGFVAFKTVSAIGKISNMVTNAGGLAGALKKIAAPLFSNPWAAGAAAVTASVAAIALAVDHYNDLRVEDNLDSHFGNISLDTSQVEALAGEIVPVKITAGLQLANVTFDEKAKLVTEAEDVLAQNNYINWKINTIHAEVSEAEYESLLTNTEIFVDNVETALEKEEYAAELTVRALLGDVESEQIIAQMQEWFTEDAATVSALGNAVTDLLQKSIDEGAYNLETQTAISIMQTKMMDIVNGAKNAELAGKLDWLSLISNGAALDADSWADVVKQVEEYQQELTEASGESYQALFSKLDQAAYNDPSRQGTVDQIKEIIGQAYKTLDESSLVQGFDWMHNTLSDAYGNELDTASKTMAESTAAYRDTWDGYFSDIASGGDPSEFFNALQTQALSFTSGLDGTTQMALLDRYETMFPTVEQMQSKIDEYANAGKAVPQALMDSYNQAIEVGAAAGDTGAMWQYYANSLVDSGEYESFMQKVEETGATIPEEFQEALTRATAETSSEDYAGVIDALIGSMSGNEVDWTEVNTILEEYGFSISDALQKQGIDIDGEVPVNAEGVKPDMPELAHNLQGLEATGNVIEADGHAMVEYEVTAGQTMSEIADQAGITLDELIAMNPQIENPDVIEVGQKINIQADRVDTDTTGVGEAVEEAASEAQAAVDATEPEPVTYEQPVDKKYIPGETDDSQLADEEPPVALEEPKTKEVPTTIVFDVASIDDSALASALTEQLQSMPAVPVDVPANIVIARASDNIGEFYSQTGTDLAAAFGTNYSVNGLADIVIAKASDNFSSLYSQVGSDLRDAFGQTYSVSANAAITVNYSIANPSKTITFDGGGSGSTTVHAHALGGIFDTPHFGVFAEAGPEAYIPIDGSENAKAIWKETGELLGMFDGHSVDAGVPAVNSTPDDGRPVFGGGSEKTINVNVNGSGNIQVSGSGVSKTQIVDCMLENMREVFMQIVSQEILEEGDGVYEY